MALQESDSAQQWPLTRRQLLTAGADLVRALIAVSGPITTLTSIGIHGETDKRIQQLAENRAAISVRPVSSNELFYARQTTEPYQATAIAELQEAAANGQNPAEVTMPDPVADALRMQAQGEVYYAEVRRNARELAETEFAGEIRNNWGITGGGLLLTVITWGALWIIGRRSAPRATESSQAT